MRSAARRLQPSRLLASSVRSIAAEHLSLHSTGDTCHQDIVLDSVEKFRQINVGGVAVATTDRGSHLLGGSMSRAFRSKAVTRLREVRIEDRCQRLVRWLVGSGDRSRLEFRVRTLTAIGFGDDLSPHRSGAVSAIEKLLSDLWPTRNETTLGNSAIVMPSGPGAPRFALHVLPSFRFMLAGSTTRSIKDSGESSLKAGCSARAVTVPPSPGAGHSSLVVIIVCQGQSGLPPGIPSRVGR